MRLKKYILGPGLDEAAYRGNIGFEEMARFYQKANSTQLKQMGKVLSNEDWNGFVQLIAKVIGTRLK